MQIITMYLRATSVKATLVDEWNQTVSALPALTRGLRAELVLKLLDENGEAVKTEGITVTANEVHVPLTETNTEELIAALGKSEQAQFGCELAGFTTGETNPEFLIQFDIIVRNRRADAGTGRPEPVGDGSYTAAQIRALFAAKNAVQISDDGETWCDADPSVEPPETAKWYRFRNMLVGYEWSDPIPLIPGRKGDRSTVEVAGTETLPAGSPAEVTNEGDEHDAKFRFKIPKGQTGTAATVEVGSVEMVPADQPAEVHNSGTTAAAVLDFKIPRGPKGETGAGFLVRGYYASVSALEASVQEPMAGDAYGVGVSEP